MGGGGQRHAPAALPPGKTRYPLYRRLGGLQGRSGLVRKILPPPGFDSRTVHPIASRYTDWAISTHRRTGKPELRWLELRKIWRRWAWGIGEVSSRTENSGGQFWKRLRSTEDWNARRKRGRKYFLANQKERQTLTYTPHFLAKHKTV